MTDQSRPETTLVPTASDKQLALPSQLISRGLALATRIEHQQGLQKYQRPIRYYAGLHALSRIAFSKDGKFAAITGGDVSSSSESLEDVIIWNVLNGDITILSSIEHGFTNLGQGGKIWDLALSSTGDLALVGYDDGDILCWDVKRNQVLYRITGSWMLESVKCLRFSPGDQSFAYSLYYNLNVHDTQSGKYLESIDNASCSVSSVFSADGSKLLSVSGDSSKLVDILGKQEPVYFRNTVTIQAFAISPDNRRVLSLDCNGLITIWDARSGDEILHWVHAESRSGPCVQCPENQKMKCFHVYPSGSMDIPPDSKKMLSSVGYRNMRLLTLDGQEICEYPHNTPVVKVAFSSDGRHALSGCCDGSVYLWELP